MYIWILLATIMVAMHFYNISPRVDKDHALNEVRAATVSNRFKIEHAAMLKTIECEIIYQKNLGCWDSASHECKKCGSDDTRISASGPVDVSCFNPIYYKENTAECSGKTCEITVERSCISDETSDDNGKCTDKMWSFYGNESGSIAADDHQLDNIVVKQYNYFTKHVPHGYDTERGRKVFPKGIHHMVYCLDEVAERAKAENFIRCDMRREQTGPINVEPEAGADDPLNLTPADPGTEPSTDPTLTPDTEPTTTTPHTTEHKLSSRTRYLVTFAQIPEKWLSKKDKAPLPILVNMLSKDNKAETVFGWTVCAGGAGGAAPKCKLYGVNARHGNIRHKKDSKHYNEVKDDDGKSRYERISETGVSINVRTFDTTKKPKKDAEGNLVLDADGNPIYEDERKAVNDYVVEYEKLPDDSVFWSSEAFKQSCLTKPCIFAYEQIPSRDIAYHCYNLMVGFAPDKVRTNDWRNKHTKRETEPENKPINVTPDPTPDSGSQP